MFSVAELMSLWEDFVPVTGQPRLALVAPLVSTMLRERWEKKPDFSHCVELPSWESRSLSDCCPRWLEVRSALSEALVGRQDREERENEVFRHGSPM